MTDLTRLDDTFRDNTILVMAIRYGDHPKLWTYTALKAGGLWYLSGGGRAPQMAQWGAVKRWLSQSGRQLVRVELVTRTETIWQPHWKHEDRVCDTCSDTGVIHEEGQPGGHHGCDVPCPDCCSVVPVETGCTCYMIDNPPCRHCDPDGDWSVPAGVLENLVDDLERGQLPE